jgi:hypothetical protein
MLPVPSPGLPQRLGKNVNAWQASNNVTVREGNVWDFATTCYVDCY